MALLMAPLLALPPGQRAVTLGEPNTGPTFKLIALAKIIFRSVDPVFNLHLIGAFVLIAWVVIGTVVPSFVTVQWRL